tara:strand:- start:253 stop:777 length:525 start_codon:yes stop_codon:yes gene_type:complete
MIAKIECLLLSKLDRQPNFSNFSSGDLFLDDFAAKKLAKADVKNDTRVYVALDGDNVVGYATMKVFMLNNNEYSILPGKYPRLVPVLMLEQIAVDKAYQSNGIGKRLMQEVIKATVLVNELAATKGLALWAHPTAISFYKSLAFLKIPDGIKQVQDIELTLMFLHIDTIIDAYK